MSKKISKLFRTRGVPGTHNTKEILNVIKRFNKKLYPIKIPLFDKLLDNKLKKKKIINKKCDILILEGWCCGCKPITSEYLYKNN